MKLEIGMWLLDSVEDTLCSVVKVAGNDVELLDMYKWGRICTTVTIINKYYKVLWVQKGDRVVGIATQNTFKVLNISVHRGNVLIGLEILYGELAGSAFEVELSLLAKNYGLR